MRAGRVACTTKMPANMPLLHRLARRPPAPSAGYPACGDFRLRPASCGDRGPIRVRDLRGMRRSRRSFAPHPAKEHGDLQVFYGSDGTRTRDLRRDRPVGRHPVQPAPTLNYLGLFLRVLPLGAPRHRACGGYAFWVAVSASQIVAKSVWTSPKSCATSSSALSRANEEHQATDRAERQSAGRRAAIKGARRRLMGARRAAESVLLDLQAHELLLGEWLAEDLLEPDRVHPTFHPCRILRAHMRSSTLQRGEVQFAALLVDPLPSSLLRERHT
jgi:hypothetical protein